ncbi:MAG: DUF6883 domain-containing protein [Dehalococcoidia bacterium]
MVNALSFPLRSEKLLFYSLNPGHPKGKHKARVFAAALGYSMRDAETLRALLLKAAKEEDARHAGTSEYGERFVIDFKVDGRSASARIRSVWEVRPIDSRPHLVTCYVL